MKHLLLCALSAFAFTSLNATTPSAIVSSAAEHQVTIKVESEAQCSVSAGSNNGTTFITYIRPLTGVENVPNIAEVPKLLTLGADCFASLIQDPSKKLTLTFNNWNEALTDGATLNNTDDTPDDMRLNYYIEPYIGPYIMNHTSFQPSLTLSESERTFNFFYDAPNSRFVFHWGEYDPLMSLSLPYTADDMANSVNFKAKFHLYTDFENNLRANAQYFTTITANVNIS